MEDLIDEVLVSWRQVANKMGKIFENNDICFIQKTTILRQILNSLPETALVDRGELNDSVIRGITHLYSSSEKRFLSERDQSDKRLAFSFKVEEAIICAGWYDREVLFSGSWVDALDFILNEMLKIKSRDLLTEKQEFLAKEYILKLKEVSC